MHEVGWSHDFPNTLASMNHDTTTLMKHKIRQTERNKYQKLKWKWKKVVLSKAIFFKKKERKLFFLGTSLQIFLFVQNTQDRKTQWKM